MICDNQLKYLRPLINVSRSSHGQREMTCRINATEKVSSFSRNGEYNAYYRSNQYTYVLRGLIYVLIIYLVRNAIRGQSGLLPGVCMLSISVNGLWCWSVSTYLGRWVYCEGLSVPAIAMVFWCHESVVYQTSVPHTWAVSILHAKVCSSMLKLDLPSSPVQTHAECRVQTLRHINRTASNLHMQQELLITLHPQTSVIMAAVSDGAYAVNVSLEVQSWNKTKIKHIKQSEESGLSFGSVYRWCRSTTSASRDRPARCTE